MIECKNPIMMERGFPAECHYGKIECCRHCNQAKQCLSHYTKEDGQLCPYIRNEKDLKHKCPFEF